MSPGLPIATVLDGRPGHESQVRGILACMPQAVDVHDVRLPDEALPGERQLAVWALAVKHLNARPPAGLLEELLGDRFAPLSAHGPKIIVAAGTRAGLYSFCLARMLWASTVQAMTHGVLKTVFTLNVVPAHDRPKPASNIVVVTTAPNPYLPEVALAAASIFLATEGLDPAGNWWSVLIGGPPAGADEDAVDGANMVAEVSGLMRRAEESGARLLISTSRRTPGSLADALRTLTVGSPTVAFFQDFRTDSRRTAGALLGAASQVFLTPDSISMVSEALWAGRGVTLLPLKRTPQSSPLLPEGKHARFLTPLLASGAVRWISSSWEPPAARIDPTYRHPDFLAIQTALRLLLREQP